MRAVKNEVGKVNTNLPELIEMVNESVSHYKRQTPKYSKLSEDLLEALSSKEILDVMDIDTRIKLLSLTQKSIVQPIESLTKLIQSVVALKEREELTSTKEELNELVAEMQDAKKHANKNMKIDALEAEVVE